jgi:hypothetical protein
MFKSQMIKKNVELELQALILLQYQLGLLQSSASIVDKEDEIMAIVMRKSKDEYEAMMSNKKKFDNQYNNQQPQQVRLPAQRDQDMETAKRLARAESLMMSLKSEIDQQEVAHAKLIEEQLKSKSSSNLSSGISVTKDYKTVRPESVDKSKRELDSSFGLSKDLSKLKLDSQVKPKPNYDDDDDIVAKSYGSTDKNKLANSIVHSYLVCY